MKARDSPFTNLYVKTHLQNNNTKKGGMNMSRKDEILAYIWDFFYEKMSEIHDYDIDYFHNLLYALEEAIKTEILLEIITEDTDRILRNEEEIIIEEEWEV